MSYNYYQADTLYNPYTVISASTRLPLSINQVKEHLSIPACDTSQNTQLRTLIKAAALQAEKYTARTLLTTTYQTTRNFFPPCISLRRSVFQSIISFDYIVSGVSTPVPAVFQIVPNPDYSQIVLLPSQCWPSNIDDTQQSVIIQFNAGYGDRSSDIPFDLQQAMLNQIADWHSNRGDCNSCSSSSSATSGLPMATKQIYDSYRIMNINGYEVCC